MRQNLVTKLGDFTKKFKVLEETYIKKYKEVNPEMEKFVVESESNAQQYFALDNSKEMLKKRDDEIVNVLNSINELASIFNDLQTLVFEQGTILDRIDYNIESALTNTKQANVELHKADENMKSNCARNAIMILLVSIFVLSVLILFKIFK